MKPHGILFQSDMIRALLNTQPDAWPAEAINPQRPFKWQTRRVVKNPEYFGCLTGDCPHESQVQCNHAIERWAQAASPHPVGTILWARETFQWAHQMNVCHASDTYPIFKATDPDWETTEGWKWKPGIHMSQWIARLWFKVMRVRVEQVNQITDEDAIAEGINLDDLYVPHVTGMLNNRKQETPSEGYQQLFDSIHGPGSFERGDFVWVYDIARITKPHRTNS